MHLGLCWGTNWKLSPAERCPGEAVGWCIATAVCWRGKGCSHPQLGLWCGCGAKAHQGLGGTRLWLYIADGCFWSQSVGEGPASLAINKWKLGVFFIMLTELLLSMSYAQCRLGQTFEQLPWGVRVLLMAKTCLALNCLKQHLQFKLLWAL